MTTAPSALQAPRVSRSSKTCIALLLPLRVGELAALELNITFRLMVLFGFMRLCLLSDVCSYTGQMRFDARIQIEKDLTALGLFRSKKPNIGKDGGCMVLPRCSRSGDVIEPLLKPQW
jgi:hypothetical protein